MHRMQLEMSHRQIRAAIIIHAIQTTLGSLTRHSVLKIEGKRASRGICNLEGWLSLAKRSRPALSHPYTPMNSYEETSRFAARIIYLGFAYFDMGKVVPLLLASLLWVFSGV